MRIRSVKPDFWRDRDTTGRWPADMKILYVGLWSVADDEGRFEMDPDLLAADLDPFRVTWPDMSAVLARIEDAGCLYVYESDGKKYGFIPKFKEHQRPNKPVPSRLPAPPSPLPERARRTPVVLPPVEERRVEEKEHGGSGPVGTGAPAAPSPLTPSAGSVFKATQAALIATFSEVKRAKYLWQGAKDSDGLKRILGLGVPLAEIQARWRSGLRGTGWKSVTNVAQLASKWNDLEVDPHDALFTRLRSEAERELGEAGSGLAGGGRADPKVGPGGGPAPAARTAVPAAVGELLGPGWQAGFVQDGGAVEPGAERGRGQAAGPVRQPGNDAGGNGVARPG